MFDTVRRFTSILLPFASACICVACGDNTAGAPDAPPRPDAPVAPPSPSIDFYDYAQVIDVSPDGTIALFGDISTLDNQLYFVDTITHEATLQTSAGDTLRAFATGVSNTRTLTALHGKTTVSAGVWSARTDWQDLPSPHVSGCDMDIASAWDLSADGTIVVGSTWNTCAVEAFRWSAATGLVRLEVLGARTGGGSVPPDNRATVIADDGTIAAGWAMTAIVDRAPAYWTADGKGHFLARTADDSPGEVLAISEDGTTFAGIDGLDGIVWRGGERVVLPRLDILLPSDPVFANAITADGSVVLGAQGSAFFGPQEAFVWSEANGLRRLSELVTAAGLAIPAGNTLANVTGVSADGTVVIGTSTNVDTAVTRGFTLRLPSPVN